MANKNIVWICPGNMAPNCAGQIGDVLVSSAVTKYLKNAKGCEILFITNEIMKDCIKNTYDNIDVSALHQDENGLFLGESDLIATREADITYILRPFGDKEGNKWQCQLIKNGIGKDKICRIGSLNAFSMDGPHMVSQILEGIGENQHATLPFPLFKRSSKSSSDTLIGDKGNPDFLVLPFAGGYEKWLPINILSDLVSELKKQGNVLVAGTQFDQEKNPVEWLEYNKEIKRVFSRLIPVTKEEIPYLASLCKKIYCVDGGMCWVTISGLNWLAVEQKWKEGRYPEITVIIGRDNYWNLAPTAAVWKPLAKFPNRVRQINGEQTFRLRDLKIKDIL
ncbi:MAG: hypothetical protein DWQ10_16875 [Calditrichaeota bacterium]|nr:MAG: hypothetical protein DWQ10_16875 [Calditrichota bacterium]